MRIFAFILIATALFATTPELARAKLCNPSREYCGDAVNSSSPTDSAARGPKIRLNPSLVPTVKGFGIETIYFDSSFDFAIVKGLGRVGAAISPSNNEETFYGPPGIEDSNDLLERKRGKHKFPSQKITLSTGFNLYENKKSGWERVNLNLGVMGRFNKVTSTIRPGGGVSLGLGPVNLGYSTYNDETQVGDPGAAGSANFAYNVSMMSAGIMLSFAAIDYSLLKIGGSEDATVSIFTGTLIYDPVLFTVSVRQEKLTRVSYDYATDGLHIVNDKSEMFYGLQVSATDWLLLGVFYNYYLVRDIAFGATIFF